MENIRRGTLLYYTNKYGEEEGKKKYEEINKKKAITLENCILRHGEEEGKKKWDQYLLKKRQKNPLNDFIKKYGEEEGKKKYEEYLLSINQSLKGFIYRYGEEEGKKRYDVFVNKSKQTLDNFILRHGEEEGKKKWDDFIQKKKKTTPRSLQYWLDKGLSNEDAINSLINFQANCSLENFILRHGEEEGTRRFLEKNKYHSYRMSKEYYIDKYGIDEGNIKYKQMCKSKILTKQQMIEKYGEEKAEEICKSRAHTLSNYIKWYGEEEGKKKYYQRIINNNLYSSYEATAFFIKIYKKCRKLGISREDIYFSCNGNNEWFIYDDNSKSIFFYDFTIPKLNLIIEYNGEHIHPNPNLSEEQKNKWKHAYNKKSFDDILKFDNYKNDVAKNNGFHVHIVWSKNDKMVDISNIMEIINDKFKR